MVQTSPGEGLFRVDSGTSVRILRSSSDLRCIAHLTEGIDVFHFRSARRPLALATLAITVLGLSALLAGSAYGDLLPATPPTVGVGNAPLSITAADLDGDTQRDLAVANFASNDVSILLGNGDGSFTPAPAVPAGTSPISVSSADLDEDGHADLAVANFGTDDVTILLGDGAGAFTAMPPVAVGVDPGAAAVSDVNGDGDLDLVVANFNGGDVSVALGNGHGAFGAATSFPVGAQPIAISAVDLNGDAIVDLATANFGSNSISVLLGNGDGTFGAATGINVGTEPIALAAADLNGDSIVDFATADFGSDTVSIALGNGDGTFAPAAAFAAPGTSPRAVAVTDLDADLYVDLAVAGFGSNTVSLFNGDGSGGFSPAATPSVAVGATPIALAAADLNGNATTDLAVLNQGSADVSILLSTTPPGAPTGATAVAGDTEATVTFSTPAADGGSGVTGYTVTASPGGASSSGASSPLTVPGLTNGTSYTFSVTATNAVGTGLASGASNAVTPAGPPPPPPPPPTTTTQAPTPPTPAGSEDVRQPSAPLALPPLFTRGALVLRWAPASDNVGVARYELLVDGVSAVSIDSDETQLATRAFRRSAPTTFEIVAVDAAGNRSTSSTGILLEWRARPDVPRLIPRWAWQLLRWRAAPLDQRGSRPDAGPVQIQPWFWTWAAWRLQPYRISQN